MATDDESVASTSSSAAIGRPDEYYEELDGQTLNLQRRKAPPTPVPTTSFVREPTPVVDPVQQLNKNLNRQYRPDLVRARSRFQILFFSLSLAAETKKKEEFSELHLLRRSRRGEQRKSNQFLVLFSFDSKSTVGHSMEALDTVGREKSSAHHWLGSTDSAPGCCSTGAHRCSTNRVPGPGDLRRARQTGQITGQRESPFPIGQTEDIQSDPSSHCPDPYTGPTNAWPRDFLWHS